MPSFPQTLLLLGSSVLIAPVPTAAVVSDDETTLEDLAEYIVYRSAYETSEFVHDVSISGRGCSWTVVETDTYRDKDLNVLNHVRTSKFELSALDPKKVRHMKYEYGDKIAAGCRGGRECIQVSSVQPNRSDTGYTDRSSDWEMDVGWGDHNPLQGAMILVIDACKNF